MPYAGAKVRISLCSFVAHALLYGTGCRSGFLLMRGLDGRILQREVFDRFADNCLIPNLSEIRIPSDSVEFSNEQQAPSQRFINRIGNLTAECAN
jgi:hypothetical protein